MNESNDSVAIDPTAGPVGYKAPAITGRQQWCCANGCGECRVVTIAFEWRTVTDLENGEVVERSTVDQDVSACCKSDLMLWDDDLQDVIPHAMIPVQPWQVGSLPV